MSHHRYSNETQKEWLHATQPPKEEMTLTELIVWVLVIGSTLGLIFGLWLTQGA